VLFSFHSNTCSSHKALFLYGFCDLFHTLTENSLVCAGTAVTPRASDTMAHVITKLAHANTHRLFVVEGGKPIAVISLTDILRYVYANPDWD
jgi:CBS-domain-containing membrane protein